MYEEEHEDEGDDPVAVYLRAGLFLFFHLLREVGDLLIVAQLHLLHQVLAHVLQFTQFGGEQAQRYAKNAHGDGKGQYDINAPFLQQEHHAYHQCVAHSGIP